MRRALTRTLIGAALVLGVVQRLHCADEATEADESPTAEVQDHLKTGLRLEEARNFGEASTEYKAALEGDPDLEEAARHLGDCYYRLGRREDAYEAYETYLDFHPDDARVLRLVDSVIRPENATALQLRLGLGYGWGLKRALFGHRFNPFLNQNGFTYGFAQGEGVAPSVELAYADRRGFETGLGLYPIFLATNGSAVHAVGVTIFADTTSVSMTLYPVLAQIGVRGYITPRLSLSTQVGLGVVLGTPYAETASDTTNDTSTGITDKDSSSYSRTLDPGLGYRGALSAQYRASKHVAFFLNAALFVTTLTARHVDYTETSSDPSGRQILNYKATTDYVAQPPESLPPTTTTTVTNPGPNRTVTTVYDDGQTHYNFVRSFANNQMVNTDFNETNTFLVGHGSDDMVFNQLSLTGGVTVEF